MYPADPKPLAPIVKLFPRLAMAHASHRTARTIGGRYHRRKPADAVDGREELRSQVRARLFRMIVDNEQVRRHEQRPNAS